MMTKHNIRVICLYYSVTAVAGVLLASFVGITIHDSIEGLLIATLLAAAYGLSGAYMNLRAIGRSASKCLLWGIAGKFSRGLVYMASLAVSTFQEIVPEEPFLSMSLTGWLCYLFADIASVYHFSVKPLSREYC